MKSILNIRSNFKIRIPESIRRTRFDIECKKLVYVVLFLIPLVTSCQTVTLYDPDSGIKSKGYLYLPESEGIHPAVIVLHGGGGLKDNHKNFARDLSGEGYVVLVVNYLAADKMQWGAVDARKKYLRSHIPVDAGYKFLRSHIAVDSERIAMVGFSRGSNYSMAFSRNDWVTSYEKNIAAIVLYYIGNKWGNAPDKNLPPTLFLHGDNDEYVSTGYIRAFCERQESKAKKPCKFHFYNNVGHGFDAKYGYNGAAKKDAFSRAVKFLDQYLKDIP